MLFLVPLLNVLAVTRSVQATPLPAVEGPREGELVTRQSGTFQCQSGYELTAYTSTGVSTCTKISGSSITPGYSAQTVAVVGLISGLTGILVTCLPVAKYFYRSGTGYFRQRDHTWEQAFPRDLINSASAVEYYQGDPVHQGWHDTYKALQAEAYDPDSTFAISNHENGTVASIFHNGFNITHNFNMIPHNETHDKWESFTDVTHHPKAGVDKRDVGWTGARISFQDYELYGGYNRVPISQKQAHDIAYDQMFGYTAGIATGNNNECAFIGTNPGGRDGRFAGLITIVSQVDYSEYFIGADCPNDWRQAMDEHDEL